MLSRLRILKNGLYNQNVKGDFFHSDKNGFYINL